MPDQPPLQPCRVAIHGAAGRMGQRLLALADADPTLAAAGAFDRGAPVSAAALRGRADVVIDFSAPPALAGVLDACVAAGVPVLVGTTGLTAAHDAALNDAAQHIAVLPASNCSVVVAVLHHLAAEAVRLTGAGWDLEVVEMHHRYKQDAPSGTALALARTLADAAGRPHDRIKLERHGHAALRRGDDITVQAVRIGDHPGEHTVFVAAPGERLELRHVSTSRDSYASGALRGAAWLSGQAAGRYTMARALGIA